MKFPMIGQEKYDLLILVTAWAKFDCIYKISSPFSKCKFLLIIWTFFPRSNMN